MKDKSMWRATFLALGISAVILGLECLVIDKAVMNRREDPPKGVPAAWGASMTRQKEITPPDWAPWSLLSGGAVTMLYSITLPGRKE